MVMGDGRHVAFWRVVQEFGAARQHELRIAAQTDALARLQVVGVVQLVVVVVHVLFLHHAQHVRPAAGLLRLPFSRLDAVFAHRQWAVDAMQLEVQPTGIADRFAFVVATPQRGRSGAAIGTA